MEQLSMAQPLSCPGRRTHARIVCTYIKCRLFLQRRELSSCASAGRTPSGYFGADLETFGQLVANERASTSLSTLTFVAASCFNDLGVFAGCAAVP